MTIKHEIKQLALKFGVELKRYNASESYEARVFRQLKVHDIDTVIDVGANDGGYGRFLRNGGFQGNILSFEPLLDAHSRLVQAAAADSAWYIAPRLAIGNEDGEIEINVAGNSTSSSILPMKALHADAAPQSRYVSVERVRISRLDTFSHPVLDRAKLILLKIDTQGYEMPVLQGADHLLARVSGLQLEMSLAPLYEGQALYRQIIDWLAERGFSLWNVIPGFTDPVSGRMLQMDGIFFKD